MSRFAHAVRDLAALTGAPLFRRMMQTRQALPMHKGIRQALAATGIDCRRGSRAIALLSRLSQSKRYRRAIAAPGSMRWSLSGIAVAVVSEAERAQALASLAAEERQRRARQVAVAMTGSAAAGAAMPEGGR